MYKISKHLNWYQYSNKLVIRNLKSSEIFSLEDSLKDIWLMISRGNNNQEICTMLQETYHLQSEDSIEKLKSDMNILRDMELIDYIN